MKRTRLSRSRCKKLSLDYWTAQHWYRYLVRKYFDAGERIGSSHEKAWSELERRFPCTKKPRDQSQ